MPFVSNPLKALKALISLKQKKSNLNKRDVARFCSQLQMLLSAGVPLLSALEIIKGMTGHNFLDQVREQISAGQSLGDSLQPYLPPMVISSIKGAEQAGNLEEVLARLSKYYEQSAETGEKIKSALIYPCFVTILSLFSLLIMFAFVMPGFKTLFLDLGTELPLISRIFIGVGDMFSNSWYWILLFMAVLMGWLARYRKTEKGALNLDKFLLRVKLFSRAQIVQAFRTLGSLLAGGVPIVESLRTTADASKNKAFKQMVYKIKSDISEGERLSQAFALHHVFPKEATQMISVGENSGQLSAMLLSVADFYEKESELFIKRFTGMLEPGLTLAVGLMVGLIALAMFLPMMNVISGLQ